jgi:hypothetical protein
MSYGLKAPEGWWGNSGTYNVGVGDETVAGQTADHSTSNDGWSGFWKDTISQVTSFAIAREAAKSGMAQQYTTSMPGQQPGPVYVPQQSAADPLRGLLPLLIVGGIVYVVASK